MSDHLLIGRGAPFDENGERLSAEKSTAGPGRAKCSCGWLSEVLSAEKPRRAAHREHRDIPEPEKRSWVVESTVLLGEKARGYAPHLDALARAHGLVARQRIHGPNRADRTMYLFGEDDLVTRVMNTYLSEVDEARGSLDVYRAETREARRSMNWMAKNVADRSFLYGYLCGLNTLHARPMDAAEDEALVAFAAACEPGAASIPLDSLRSKNFVAFEAGHAAATEGPL